MSKTMRELKEEWSDTEKEEMRKAHRNQFGLDGAFDPDEYIFEVQKNIKSIGIDFIQEEELPTKLEHGHYDIGIDTFQRMRANATFEEAMGFIRWNIDKYNTRNKGQDEEDYLKIEAYCKEARWWFKNNRG